MRDGRSALDALAAWLRSRYGGARVLGVGHRVVHGGARFAGPTVVTPGGPGGAAGRSFPWRRSTSRTTWPPSKRSRERLPGVPQVACFDTSFHRGQPAVAELVPLPREIRDTGVQRYGFHGLSYEYIASVLPQVAPEIAEGRVIVAHLGSGASLCALRNGKSVDSSLGFTALDGLCMGTRPGRPRSRRRPLPLPGPWRSRPRTWRRSSTRSRACWASPGSATTCATCSASAEPGARLAVDYFVYRAAKEIGALAAVLGGLDGLVFTAGIGENSAEIRRRIGEASAWLGIEIDPEANEARGPAHLQRRAAGSRPG